MSTDAPAPRRRRGRPSREDAGEGPGARERILAAARGEFAERGYDKASIRAIARRADVDPALVHHYFGPKEQVFEAALEVDFAPAMELPEVIFGGASTGGGGGAGSGVDEGAGERLTRYMLGVWESALTREPLLAVVRSAVNNEAAAAIFRRVVVRNVLRRVTPRLAGPDAELRAELAVAQLVGVAMLRYVVKVEPLASAGVEEIVARVAPVVQRHLAGA
ncbi:TetR family transcriptional regulator [Streptomyces polyrhachis]|uniref:TetR family transcriptional regulator n=1 Tax=Streptomyces polyrhachis TaxID=1282885 RepID=A0ABW2G8A9_9ACTN